MESTLPLADVRVVTLALNLPGPACVRRLADLGASVIKIESPSGDPLRLYARDYHRELHEGIPIHHLDLKSDAGQAALSALLEEAQLLVTAQRPAALARLGLDFANIRRLWPHLSQVAIVGHAAPFEDRAGHDLTYLAEAGLLQPPALPATLMADLLGAERAVSAALCVLRAAQKSGQGEYSQVALADAATVLAAPARHGLTRPDGLLGGAHAGYRLYRTADGWLALAALEPHFLQRLVTTLNLPGADADSLAAAFIMRTGKHWQEWALREDIPLTVLPPAGAGA